MYYHEAYISVEGANSYGQLGLGGVSEECPPTEVNFSHLKLPSKEIIGIYGGGGHTFLLRKNGDVYGCGWNNCGQLGSRDFDGLNFYKLKHLEIYNTVHLSSKWDSCYGVTATSRVLGWGSNMWGQLGKSPSMVVCSREAVILMTEDAVQVEAGLRHCAVLSKQGLVFTCGDNRKGQLGRATTPNQHYLQPVVGLPRVKMLSCGQYHTLALSCDGRLFGWGDNKFGQVGLDPGVHPTVPVPTQVPIPSLSDPASASIHSGWTHSAILTGNGNIINWGRNNYGQLGSDRDECWSPQLLGISQQVKQLALGSEHNLALTDDGQVLSWGWNEHGSCGVESGKGQHTVKPTIVPLHHTAIMVGVGSAQSFALTHSHIIDDNVC